VTWEQKVWVWNLHGTPVKCTMRFTGISFDGSNTNPFNVFLSWIVDMDYISNSENFENQHSDKEI
jgi:hypothetical protein